MKRQKKSIVIYLLFLSWAVFFLINQYPNFADDPGVGWHLKTGEYIAQNKIIPISDPFLFSVSPRPWISDQWLADYITYELFKFGSWRLVYSAFCILFLLSFALIALSILKYEGRSLLASLIALIYAIRLAAIHFILRPVLISIFFFTLLYSRLVRIKSLKPIKIDYYILVPLFILWANIHPSFILGLSLFGILVITKKFEKESALLATTCALVTLLNPYGYRLHQSILQLWQSSYFMHLNSEWIPINYSSEEFLILLSGFIFSIYSLINNSQVKKNIFEVSCLGIFFLLLFHSVRFLPYFAVLSILPLARALDNYIEKRKSLALNLTSRHFAFAGFAAAAAVIFLYPYPGRYGPSQKIYPVECMEVLQDVQSAGKEVRLLAHPNLGGFIILNNLMPLLDDRNTLLGEEAYKDFFENMKPQEKIIPYLKSTNATHLLLSSSSPLPLYLTQIQSIPQIACKNRSDYLILPLS